MSEEKTWGWLVFALVTVATWGVYGVLLHSGQVAMEDAENGRWKAFLFVGVAYFLAAVLAPAAMLVLNGASWRMPMGGIAWSLVAGLAGAAGAFAVLLAFASGGMPSVVMSIVFAGAPIVNAAAAIVIHPPKGGLVVRWPFLAGILLAAAGGCLVTYFRPTPAPSHPAQSAPAEPHSTPIDQR